jgi:hydrogenase maturation protein HypF
MALSHLHAAGIAWDRRLPCVAACTDAETTVLARQLQTGLACIPTSSMGRLFDAMSSLAGVCHRVAYEAEAAMRFEELARGALGDRPAYAFGVADSWPLIADSAPVVAAAAHDVLRGVPAELIAARFHLAVVELVVGLARSARRHCGQSTVALSGGVFLNVLLTVLCRQRLQHEGFQVLTQQRVPPSDAGLALGQLMVGARIPAAKQRS